MLQDDDQLADATRRQPVAENLQQSKELFRLLVESVQDFAIFMLDPQGNLLLCNPVFARMVGFTSVEEALATSTFTLFPNL